MIAHTPPWSDKGLPKHKLAVVIGRFQGLHHGQYQLIDFARSRATETLLLVGSAYKARDPRNPFTYDERKEALLHAFPDHNATLIQPIRDDIYNNNVWYKNVQAAVADSYNFFFGKDKKSDIVLFGHEKDRTSSYLRKLPYDFNEVGRKTNLNSTDLREKLFNREIYSAADMMPGLSKQWLIDWTHDCKDVYETLIEEHEHIEAYRKQYAGIKYPPIFVTVDAVVLCRGHVLLVRRKCAPGKGLWALPGGFLEQLEDILAAIIRELLEETSIAVSEGYLQAALKDVKVFGHPDRSLRGRTITHVGVISLDHLDALPRIRGQESEVSDVRWFPLSEFYEMEPIMFEDHYHIINHSIGHPG